jgi:hypothetical protein
MDCGGTRRNGVRIGIAVVGAALPLLWGSAASAAGPQVKEPKYGFTMTLPNQWKTVPLNGGDIKSLLNSATDENPDLTNALTQQVKAAAEQGVKVFAIGPIVDGSVPNVSVITASAAGTPTGSAFPGAAAAQAKISLTSAGAVGIKSAVVKNHMGDTAEVIYKVPLKTGAIQGAQIYVQHGPRVVVVTVTTKSSASSQALARTIVKGWKWD